MCGRFETNVSLEALVEKLKEYYPDLFTELENETNRKENIAPTNNILTLTHNNNKYKLTFMKWGIKFSEDSPLIFNSRIETIKSKKFWFNLFNKNRCLIPMTAFYEWKKEGSRKVPYRIFLKNEDMFFVPGLYIKPKESDEIQTSLITTTPNKFIKPIHHRMPVVFKFTEALNYLTEDAEQNLSKCIPFKENDLMNMQKAAI